LRAAVATFTGWFMAWWMVVGFMGALAASDIVLRLFFLVMGIGFLVGYLDHVFRVIDFRRQHGPREAYFDGWKRDSEK
jgi:uncharacterized membrane protein